MKKSQFKKDQKYGDWTLSNYLGGGGNGEVWECMNSKGTKGAIKLLRSVKAKPYMRFLDETITLEKNSDVIGIVPMIDKYLPQNLGDEVPFYVMPVAENAYGKLKDQGIESKVDAMLQICETLRELHKRGISHRDIKPANILLVASRYSLCDFGLVDYPDKKDVSLKNEEIGAKWTIAPEMRRESSKADGLKADVYSLAKTLWIFLTGNLKGFDGQYSPVPGLEFGSIYRDCYTTPIDKLLTSCTDNNPSDRPDINQIISALEDWKILNENFHARNLEQWLEIQKNLFPTAFPKRVVWEEIDDIVSVLKIASSYDNLNHMFFPGGGGMDLEDVRLASEENCVELDCGLIEIVKPKRLIFESFAYDPEWNYFRLEIQELKPSIVHEREEGEQAYEKEYDHEAVSELYSGQYEDYNVLEDRSYYSEMGYDIPDSARHVTRWFRGVFVIFNKRSPYNLTNSTYDGRHNDMDTDSFREYIQGNVDRFRSKYGRRSSSVRLFGRSEIED